MTTIANGLFGFSIAALFIQLATTIIAGLRLGRATGPQPGQNWPPVTIIRPVRGLENVEFVTLASTFRLETANVEVIFCCASSQDSAIPYLQKLLRENPHVNTKLLIGEERKSLNPKLDNVLKGWRAASHDWIILADSNLMLPPDYVAKVLSGWTNGAGVVCAPPIGARPENFPAEIECAFLNTYQARWQYTADAIGFGFAQGKTMLWRYSELEAWGGISILGREIAEDAAATKLVRAAGRRVRLAVPPFEQPLGRRTLSQTWFRQLRWAQLRRASFPLYFSGEIFTGILPPMIASAIAVFAFDAFSPFLLLAGAFAWFSSEAVLAAVAGWHLNWRSPFVWLLRDAMIAPLWISAWVMRSYDWRGNEVATRPTVSAKAEPVALSAGR